MISKFKQLHKVDNSQENEMLKENLRTVAINLHAKLGMNNILLTKEDVRLLYDVDDVHRYLPSYYKPIFQKFRTINVEDNAQKKAYSRAFGIGFSKEIQDLPTTKETLAYALDCNEDEVLMNNEDLNSKKKVYYDPSSFSYYYKNPHLNLYGSDSDKSLLNSYFTLELNNLMGVNFPEVVLNEFYLNLNSINEDIILPQRVNGNCTVNLKSANSIKCSEYVGGTLDLRNLEEVGILFLPEFVRQSINLDNLKRYDKIFLPVFMGEFSSQKPEIRMSALDNKIKKRLREENPHLIII